MFTKYGYFTIGVVTIIVFVLFVVAIFIQNNYIKYPLVLLGLSLMAFTLYFFRDPERVSPVRDDIVVSPADGTVLLVKDVVDNRYINGDAKQVSIFMSPFNVHVNRIPVTGKVEYLNYVEGEYLIASHDKADERNERNEIGIQGSHSKVLFTQVAGYVARRIVSELNSEQEVIMGERFGMIKFGSRVDVVVPPNIKINVKAGDKVTAGETILFEYINE